MSDVESAHATTHKLSQIMGCCVLTFMNVFLTNAVAGISNENGKPSTKKRRA